MVVVSARFWVNSTSEAQNFWVFWISMAEFDRNSETLQSENEAVIMISAKILCKILPQKARNHDIRDKKARKCDIRDKKKTA